MNKESLSSQHLSSLNKETKCFMKYIIEEMSFKCLLDVFWTVLPRDIGI